MSKAFVNPVKKCVRETSHREELAQGFELNLQNLCKKARICNSVFGEVETDRCSGLKYLVSSGP